MAPGSLRRALDELIVSEIEAPEGTGRIIFKMNSLVDAKIIDRLYEASQAGVRIDLIIRGICCLIPGVPGMSENIRVRSLVGKNLEHSRVYYFANGGSLEGDESGDDTRGREAFYLGSADLMPRNLDRRVEVLLRVDDDESKVRLHEILRVNLEDTALAWELEADGTYRRVGGDYNAHDVFEELAAERTEVSAEVPTGPPTGPAVRLRQFLPRRRSNF